MNTHNEVKDVIMTEEQFWQSWQMDAAKVKATGSTSTYLNLLCPHCHEEVTVVVNTHLKATTEPEYLTSMSKHCEKDEYDLYVKARKAKLAKQKG